MNNQHSVIVTFKAKTDRIAEFTSLMESVKNDLPSIDGCDSVCIYKHNDDAETFTLIENWRNEELHSDHISGLVKSGAWAKIEAMLSEPPSTQFSIQL